MLFQLTNVAICHWFSRRIASLRFVPCPPLPPLPPYLPFSRRVWHSSIPFACNYPANLFELSTAAVTNSYRKGRGGAWERGGEGEELYLCQVKAQRVPVLISLSSLGAPSLKLRVPACPALPSLPACLPWRPLQLKGAFRRRRCVVSSACSIQFKAIF